MPRTIEETITEVHNVAKSKGWWPEFKLQLVREGNPETLGSSLALIHSEVSEALEAVRDGLLVPGHEMPAGKPVGFHVELADAVIRIFDLVGAMDDGDAFLNALEDKIAYNKTRPHRHGGKQL